MRRNRPWIPLVVACTLVGPWLLSAGEGALSPLTADEVVSVRVKLNPWGAWLGFETEVPGDHPGVRDLITAIRRAQPAQGHKCANEGEIRILKRNGKTISLGILQGHTDGWYEFRLYEDGEYVAFYRVVRRAFVVALESIGVPSDDPAIASSSLQSGETTGTDSG